jgi:HEAT repeat protein
VLLVFGVSAAFAPLKAAQSALFLGAYGAENLPWAFAASAVVLALTSGVCVGLGGRWGPVRLCTGTLLLFSALLPVLWLAQGLPGMAFVTYVVVEVCLGLLVIHTWSVVSEATNARSAKRLLPLAGVGTSLAWTLGGAAVPALVPLIGERGLLLVGPLGFAVALVALRLIVRKDLAGRAARGRSSVTVMDGWKRGLDFVRSTPLMRLVAALSVLALVSEQLMDLQMLHAVEEHIDPERIAGFLGMYYSLSSFVGLAFSLLLTGRLLERLGSTRTLLAAPAWMLVISAAVIAAPGLVAATALRGGYRILKQGLWSSSLVQAQVPLPVVRRAQSRALVRGVIAPMGYAGTALLVAALDGVSPRWLAIGTLVLGVVSCIVIALKLRGAYAGALEASVDDRKLVLNRKTARPKLGAATVHELEQSLRSGPTLQAGLAVELLASSDEPSAFRHINAATQHRSAEVRVAAVHQLARAGRSTGAPVLAHMLGRDASPEVRLACARALAGLGSPAQGAALTKAQADMDPRVRAWARVALASISREPADRLLAHPEPHVREAAVLGLKTTTEQVSARLDDGDRRVRAAAVRAALRHPSLLQRTLSALEDPSLVPAVSEVLPALSPALVKQLGKGIDAASPRAVRNLALACRGLRGGAAELLLELLDHPHPTVREETTRALGAAVRDPDRRLPSKRLLPMQDHEIALAWQMVAIQGGLARDDGNDDWRVQAPFDVLAREVEDRLEACRKRLLCLLALSGERRLVGAYEVGLRGRTEGPQVAELVEVSLSRARGEVLVPLFAPLSLRERFKRGRGIGRIAENAFGDPLGELDALGDPGLLGVAMVVYAERFRERYPQRWEDSLHARTQRLLFLREVPIFRALSLDDLHQVAAVLEERAVPMGETILKKGDPGDELLIIVAGAVRIVDGAELAVLGPPQFFGELSLLDHEPRAADAIAAEDTTLLSLRAADLEELMSHRPSIQDEILRELARRLREASRRVRA